MLAEASFPCYPPAEYTRERGFLFFLPAPSPFPLTRLIFSSLREFQHGAFAIKTMRAWWKRQHCAQATLAGETPDNI